MSLTRRSFLRNLGSLVGALSVGLTVLKPQKKKVETFRNWPVTENSYLVGYKGNQFFETGIVYAPYIPLYTTATIPLTKPRNLLQLG